MADNRLRLRRSAVPGKIPTTSSLELGEVAINTYDGILYLKKSGSGFEEVIGLSTGSGTDVSYLETTASDHETRIDTLETTPAGLWTASDAYISRESDVHISGSLFWSGSETGTSTSALVLEDGQVKTNASVGSVNRPPQGFTVLSFLALLSVIVTTLTV